MYPVTMHLSVGRQSIAILWALACSQPALAQAIADEEASREPDIIVTAQKREEAASNIGASIDVASGATLRERGIDSIAELERIVPGLSFTQTPLGPPVLTLRGIGFYDATISASPAVSVYLDEAPLALPVYSQVTPIDLARVEVLKGPQGTLFGENSTGGAINYVAAKPTDKFSAGGSFGVGRFSTIEAEGFVSGPLSDVLRARAAFRTVQSGDWQKSYTRDDTLGETHQTAGRLILDWQPGAAVRLSLNLNGWIDTSDTQAFQLRAVECGLPTNCDPELLAYPLAPENARAADWNPDFPMRVDDSFGQAVLRAEIDLSDAITLTSIGGYQRFGQDKYIDQDATAIENLHFRQEGSATSVNQELRLAGDGDRLDWIAGGYLANIDATELFNTQVTKLSLAEPLPGLFPPLTTSAGRSTFKIRSYAAFGHVEFRLTDRLKASAGLRYTHTSQRFTGCTMSGDDPTFGNVTAFLGALIRGELPTVAPVPEDGCLQLDRITFLQGKTRDRLSEDNLSYRLGLDYRTAGGALLYGNVSRGYKAGSFSSVAASNSAQFLPVTQESVLALEAGIKAPLAGGKIRAEAAIFHYDYRDKQLRGRIVDQIFGPLEALVNVPRSRIRGVEAGISARPVAGLTLSASASYVDSKVREFTGITPTGATRDFAGSAFPYAPKWQAVGDGQYEWAPVDRWRAFLGGGATWHGRTWTALGEDDAFRLKPYLTLDLRAGFGPANERWRVTVYGQNVTDTYYWNNVFEFVDTRFRIAARPATYGLRFDVRY